MKNGIMISLALSCLLFCGAVQASRCDAYFKFDGSLADASGNGYDGLIVSTRGATDAPVYEAGKYGQALQVADGRAVRTLLDLHHEGCPQFTFSAWFRLRSFDAEEPQYLLSSGARGGIPALVIRDTTLTLHGRGNGLSQRNAVANGETWYFVAATFDYTTRQYSLFWQGRFLAGTLRDEPYTAEDALWIGTRSDDLFGTAESLLIDDVRVYGRLLEPDEIRELASSEHDATGPADIPLIDLQGPIDSDAGMPALQPVDTELPGQLGPTVATPEDLNNAADNDEPQSLDALRDAVNENNPLSGAGEAIQDRLDDSRPPDLEADQGGGAAEEPQPEPRTTTPHPVGEKRYSGVSGSRGDILRELELVQPASSDQALSDTAWLYGVEIEERNNRPCGVWLNGLQPKDPADGKRHEVANVSVLLENCGDGGGNVWPGDLQAYLELGQPSPLLGGDASAVGQVQVCDNDRDNKRIKGIRVNGAKIRADGSQLVEGNADAAELANCRRWRPAVICPADTLGTGLVIHATRASGANEQIVGLQLICREISIEY